MNLELIATAGLVLLAVAGAVLDLTTRRLPNWLSLSLAVSGLAYALAAHGAAGAGSGLLHGLAALAIGMVLFRIGAIGGGDAKFYSGIATWFALAEGARLLLSVSLSGLALFAAWFAARRLMGRKVVRNSTSDADKFPYGIAIAAGAILARLTA